MFLFLSKIVLIRFHPLYNISLVWFYTAWWTETHVCEQRAQGCYLALHRNLQPQSYKFRQVMIKVTFENFFST